MIIRLAKPDDTAILGKLLRQLGYPSSEEECSTRITQYSKPDYQLWIGEVDHQVIGFIALHQYHAIHHTQPIGRVIGFCVDENCRGKGFGSQLLLFAENLFQEQGCFKVELTSNLKRTSTHGYYISRGYQQKSKHLVKML